MSYDIYLVRRDPGQSFEDALEATEESFEGDDPGPLSVAELEQWDDILPVAREVLGAIEEFGDETTRELTDPATGIQLSLFNGEVAVHVPFGDNVDNGADLMAKVYELARAIERATGLEGYDPQLREPISEQPGGADVVDPQDRESFAAESSSWDEEDDDESSGTSTSLPAVRTRRGRDQDGSGNVAVERRWWEFWKQ